MCGLAGVLSSNMGLLEHDVFKQLLAVATLRGQFGAGILAVPTKGKCHVLRNNQDTAAELAYSHEFYKYLKGHEVVCLMGHARAPTTGGWTIEDCHPIIGRHVLGMHNGTLTHLHDKKLTNKEHDSRLFFESVDNQGLEATIKKTAGAYAITLVNKQTQRVQFIRNNDRPLSFAMVEDQPETLYWASETMMLKLVLERMTRKKVTYYRLPPDTLLTFKLFFNGAVKHESALSVQGAPKPAAETKASVPAVYSAKDEWFPTLPSNYVTALALGALLAKGCVNCLSPRTLRDYHANTLVWTTNTEFVCRPCLEVSQIARDCVTTNGIPLPTDLPALPSGPTKH